MQRDSRAYLWDIQQATDAILRFVAGLDAKIYRNTDVVHSAVERKFEIIGEALSQLSKANPALARRIPDVRKSSHFETFSSTDTPPSTMIVLGGSRRRPSQAYKLPLPL